MMGCPSPNGEVGKKRGQFSLLLPFVQFKPSKDWMMPTHIEEGNNFFKPQIQMLISSTNTFTDTETMLNQVSGYPVALSS